jgi:hypothetical protein
MAGVEHGLHGAVHGGIDLAVGGDDGDAVAQQALGEGGIGNLGDGNGSAAQGGVELVAVKNRSLLRLAKKLRKESHNHDFLSKWWIYVSTGYGAVRRRGRGETMPVQGGCST